jgi:Ni,Fe-hydrogenase III small subunit/formate hydrogenlyase subunit 6/NADH:ubiquinone oxidoreductase subunit I
MFDTLLQSFKTGIVTTAYPKSPPQLSSRARGRPDIDWAQWKDARPAARVCPTGAIDYRDQNAVRTVTLDLGKCIFCGLCADVDPAIRMTNQCELAQRSRAALQQTADYRLHTDGTHAGKPTRAPKIDAPLDAPLDALATQLRQRAQRLLGRSLHIREVDAGSCNGCEVEIVGLTGPIYDVERFGIHFVASPRHADMLLVTGPVTRNMELALRKTYDATPEPRLVVAVGACGCSGGMFGQNYATCGAVDAVIPVDVYIPGCPPNPYALIHGILRALDRLK